MPAHSETFDAIGTRWHIETQLPLEHTVLSKVRDCIETFDVTYSRFRPDSLIMKVSEQPGTYDFPDDVIPLMSFYRSLYDVTDGQVTPLVGSMLEKAGYDAMYIFRPSEQTELPHWDDVMTWNGSSLTTTQPVTIDIGAAGKGYLVDKIGAILDQHNVHEYVIDASGDILHKGPMAETIGLEHPSDPSKVIGAAIVKNASICASASNRRQWGSGMHHIFDPKTKEPTREIIASWAVADQAMIADGLATALFFAEPEKLAISFDYQYVRMHKNEGLDYSFNFNGELFE
jgi:thiamine biosynthesis lipoprotein